jgi:dTDP-4-dehydrorhamnose reductase
MNVLIVGGNSRLAQEIKKITKRQKIKIYPSYRNRIKQKLKINLLEDINFKNIKTYLIKKNISAVIFCAGITNYYQCKKDFKKAFLVNCTNTVKLIKFFINLKIFTCFVSTNTVFEKKNPQNEYAKKNPKFEYSIMKNITEERLISYVKKNKLKKYFSILRLTKNVNKNTEPFNIWIKSLKKNKKVRCFEDLFFAPIRFKDSAQTLLKIAKNKIHGIFHLSGAKDLNYYEFAKLLSKKIR